MATNRAEIFDLNNLPPKINLSPRANDLSKKKFGRLQPLYPYDKNYDGYIWVCRCDCGNYCRVVGKRMTRTKKPVQSCGCLQDEYHAKQKEESIIKKGTLCGGLKVISNEGNKYLVECIHCNRQFYTEKENLKKLLRKNKDSSCGCMKGEFISQRKIQDLTGQKINNWTVLETTCKTIKGIGAIHKCQCDCGRIEYLDTVQLKHKRKSCGCQDGSMSKDALKIRNFLDELKECYLQEYTFSDLLSENNIPLRFDFCLYDDNGIVQLIEVQGRQHYVPVDLFGGEQEFKIRQEHDRKKLDYCKQNQIPLLILSYEEIPKMTLKEFKERLEYNGKQNN